MSSDYKIIVKNTTGTKVAEVYDYHTIAYTKRVNDPGIASIQINGGHSLVTTLANNYQVEIHRRNADLSLDWYADFYGLYRAQDRFYTDRPLFTLTCPEVSEQLRWRYVGFPAETANRTQFTNTAAEFIMKTLVSTNIANLATSTLGRVRNGDIDTITVQTNANNGNSLDWSCAWKNLLGELQAIARVGGGDFDLVPSSTAGQWRFEWFTGQRGNDLSSTVIFALERGNMENPIYRYNRLSERTVAIVGGQGETSNRATAIRYGTDYTSSSNDIEIFVDARSFSTSTGLNSAGDKRLDETQARQEFEYKVLQTPASAYGVHYCTAGRLGDLITARYDTVQVTQKIVGVTVTIAPDGSEKIDVETETK